jgi:hypothetical protein
MTENKQNIDELNKGWIQSRSWDLPTTLWQFLNAISFPNTLKPAMVKKFLDTPAAKPMPKQLRTEVEKWIKDNK